MSGGGSAPSSQTVTNVSQPPAYVQQESQNNYGIANSLASNPYPMYQGQLIAPMNDLQNTGVQAVTNSAYGWVPYTNQATNQINTAIGENPINNSQISGMNPVNTSGVGAMNPLTYNPVDANSAWVGGYNPLSANLAPTAQNIGKYMSPYVQQSLAPQLQAAQQNLAQQQLQTNAQATQANAFGDARQGVENALNNYYGNQTMAGIEGQGYNAAYQNALATAQQQQQFGLNEQGVAQNQTAQLQAQQGMGLTEQQILQAQQGYGLTEQQIAQNQQNLGLNEQGLQLGAAGQIAGLGQQYQNQNLSAANSLMDAGTLQQQNSQQQLNAAYEQFLNQSQWPYQMLNLRESAVTNSPYAMANQVTLPGANPLATGLGGFASLAGQLGSLTSNQSQPFG